SDLADMNLQYSVDPAYLRRNACTRQPVDCGQVLKLAGYTGMYDDGGRWYARGEQFFQPGLGINYYSMEDDYYWQSTYMTATEYWLGKMQDQLRANLVRIEIKLPYRYNGTLITSTSYGTLLDFIERANSHNMRVGIVMHN